MLIAALVVDIGGDYHMVKFGFQKRYLDQLAITTNYLKRKEVLNACNFAIVDKFSYLYMHKPKDRSISDKG